MGAKVAGLAARPRVSSWTRAEITNCFGAGEYRIGAYGLEARGLRWEVFTTLLDTNPKASTHVERS